MSKLNDFWECVKEEFFLFQTQCAFSLCQNGGTCVPNVKNKTFRCDCKIGFTGYFCEIGKYVLHVAYIEVSAGGYQSVCALACDYLNGICFVLRVLIK